MNTPSPLSTLLGREFAGVQKIERYLSKLVTEKTDSDDNNIDSYTTSFIDGISKFLQFSQNDFKIFQTIELEKRSGFFDAIKNSFDNVKEKISRFIETDQLNKLMDELFPILHYLCYFDFSRHRLSFASTAIEQLNTLKQYEQNLLKLIEQMRDETHVNDALNTEYYSLKSSRKKLVFAVLGCRKSAKSSFINYLLQETICPVDTLSATARITRIIYGSQWKVYLEGEQGEEMNNINSLYRKATELIILQGADRDDKVKCKMKVIIELPIKQLKNIELWDLPGLEENSVLNEIVSTIFPDVDLVFALLPIDGGVSLDFLNNIEKCLTYNRNASGLINETHDHDHNIAGFQQQVCFVITKVDSVPSSSQTGKRRDVTLQELSITILERMKNQFNVEINLENANPMLTPRFISMCTESTHLNDFLHCLEEFYHKSATFFKPVVNEIMYRRMNHLSQVIYELLQYDDIDRTIKASQQLTNIIHKRQQNLEDDLKKKLDEHMKSIREDLRSHVINLWKHWSPSKILFANESRWDDAVETIRVKFKELMKKHRVTILQSAREEIDNFFVALDLHPGQEQLVKQAMSRAFLQNPYKIIIGQYEIQSAPNRTRELAWTQAASVLPNTISNIVSLCLTPVRFLKNLRKAAEETLSNITEPNIQKEIDQCFDNIITEINLSIQDQVKKVLDEIEAKKEIMLQAKKIEEVNGVAHFISYYEPSITKLYLDIQHEKSCAKYAFFEMSNEKLGSDDSSVYVALLAIDKHSEKIRIAAKKVKLQKFCCQDLYYIDNYHKNIVKLYGIRCSSENDEYYYILMEKLDCDLSNYLLENKNNLLDSHIDKMIMQIVNGLHYLHNRTLIHRDVKSANILVRKCEPPVFLISALSFLPDLSSAMKDTPCYIAPELTNADSFKNDSTRYIANRFACGYVDNNSLSAKTDIYALGVTITEIYETSNIRRHGQYFKFWSSIANRCCSSNCAKRPTCQEILVARRSCLEKAGKSGIFTSLLIQVI
ncbi:unnamed protein product [Rotaria socialis]